MTFNGLNTAMNALRSHRTAMEITGHNIANAQTKGYSRQRALLAPAPSPISALWAKASGAGSGVIVTGVERLRDAFYESRGHVEHGTQGMLDRAAQVLTQIEDAYSEPGDKSIGAQMAEFWSFWDDVANQPDQSGVRYQILAGAATLAESFRRADGQMQLASQNLLEQTRANVDYVNATATRIATLNGEIETAVQGGFPANDLMDQRDLLVTDLSERIGVTVKPRENGVVDVILGSIALVRSRSVDQLTVDVQPGGVDLRWASHNQLATGVGGTVGGDLAGMNDLIPRYRAELDTVAAALITQVNTQHALGEGLDGTAGRLFFDGTDAATITVHADVDGLPDNIGARGAGLGVHDGSNAQALANLALSPTGPDVLYRGAVGKLGVESQAAGRRSEVQREVVKQVDAMRDATAGVNLDEEMANLMQIQHAYSAAARVMSTVDSALDTLINRTGIVGR